MQKSLPHRRLVLLIFIPPVLAVCLCAILLIPQINNFFNSPVYPDYLWSLRITRALSDKGYPVHDVSILEGELSGFRDIEVQIGNLIDGKRQRSYELVKDVHLVIMNTFANDPSQPKPVNVITITVIDYSSGSYMVSVNYETAKKFYAGEISEKVYFENWSYPENTPEITPP